MTKRQPIVVLVGVLMECDSRVRGRGRDSRSCATENTHMNGRKSNPKKKIVLSDAKYTAAYRAEK